MKNNKNNRYIKTRNNKFTNLREFFKDIDELLNNIVPKVNHRYIRKVVYTSGVNKYLTSHL